MAIALRGTPTNSGTASSGSLTINKPTGVVSGDVLIATIEVSGASHVPGTPSGFTLIDSDANGPSVASYRRVCDGTEGASFTWTVGFTSNGIIRAYSGVDNTTPIDAHSAWNRLTSTHTATASTITTVTNACMLVFAFGAGLTGTSFADPTGFGNQGFNTQTTNCAGSDDMSQTTAGATGSVTTTITGGSAGNVSSTLIALRPAAGGAVAYTLTATAGSMAITGSAATLKTTRQLTVSPTTYTVTGLAATPVVARKLVASPGSASITGSPVTPRVARKLTSGPAAFAITGSAATPVVARKLVASPAAFTITGASVTLVAPVAYQVSASPAALTITGSDATLVGPAGVVAQTPGGKLFHTPIPRRRKLERPAQKVTFVSQPATILVDAAPARLTVTLTAVPATLNGMTVAGTGRMAVAFSTPVAVIGIGSRVAPVSDAFTRKAQNDLAELVRDTLCALEL